MVRRSTPVAVFVTQCSNRSWRNTTPSTACPRGGVVEEEEGVAEEEEGVADPEAEGGASPRTRWLSWQHTLYEKHF